MSTAINLNKDVSTSVVKGLLFITLFFPSLFGYLDLSAGQFVLLFSLFATFAAYGLFRGQISNAMPLKSILYSFVTLHLCYLITILSVLAVDVRLTFSDVFDIFRPLIYLFYIAVTYGLLRDRFDITSLTKFFVICILLMSLLDFIKFIPQLQPLIKLYAFFPFGSINFIRFSGTFAFCYNYGFIVLFGIYLLLYNKEIKWRLLYILLFSIFIIATGSRSVIAAYFFSLALYFMFSSMSLAKKIFVCASVVILFTTAYLYVREIDSPIVTSTVGYVEKLAMALSGNGYDSSMNTRSGQLQYSLESANKNIIFGVGPQKYSGITIEIMLGYYLSSWGIMGLGVYLYILALLFYYAYCCSKSGDLSVRAFSQANMLWIISVFVVGMSTPIIDQVRVSNIFYLFQAIQLFYYTKYRLKQ